MLSTGAVLKELKITRMTLYKWIDKKVILPIIVKQAGRSFFSFDLEDVLKVKSQIKETREAGKSLLKTKKKEKRRAV